MNTAIEASEYGAETSSYCELHANRHLEELSDGLVIGSRDTEWVSGKGLQREAIFIFSMIELLVSGRTASERVGKHFRVTLQAQFSVLNLAVDEAKVADRVLADI